MPASVPNSVMPTGIVPVGTVQVPARYGAEMYGSVTVHIDAPPDRVWSLVSDVTQIGRFSPETFDAEWVDGATGPAAGARFRGHVRRNERGPVYWTTCTVVECEANQKFSFYVG